MITRGVLLKGAAVGPIIYDVFADICSCMSGLQCAGEI